MKVVAAILTLSILCSMKTLAQNADEDAVKSVITRFFDGMRNSDTSAIRSTVLPGARLETIINKEGKTWVKSDGFEGFLSQIGKPHTDIYDERVSFKAIQIDGALATAWTPYKFYIGERFSHCGVNAFQLVKTDEGWKIQSIIDTRRKENCLE
jgi:hypothetical protein